ncbi:MAG: RNA 2',3'-cyclic phosphodiesterase [Actinobacteria bacterium]|nr:RNA 2',3'-cyclic phosphodiesterase [Actinomycetota bacterium]
MEDVARLFVAVPLTDDARAAMAARVREAAPGGLPGRVVRPPNWHLTLRFLGDVAPADADRLAASLDAAALGAPFAVRWAGLGAFPRAARATVLWVGADRGAAELEALAAAVEDACGDAGFPPEDRPFRAHLTLARIRPPADVRALIEAAGEVRVPMPVDRVVVYRSHLGRGGARYEEVEVVPLG